MKTPQLDTPNIAFDFRIRPAPFLILAALVAFLFTGCGRSGPTETRRESVYDRVMRTKKIRAAWLTYPPAAMKDTVTKKLSGTFVEVLEHTAKSCGLDVEWMDQETPWGNLIEGLNEDRYDIVGSPVWANYERGKFTTLSRPVYYSGIGIYVRQNDKRFPDDWTTFGSGTLATGLINKPEVRISTIDGETGDVIARAQFPAAQRIALPQNSDIPQLFLEVANNKADVLFAEPYFAYGYTQNNPGKIRNIAARTPVRVLGNDFMMKKNESQFKQMIDVAIEDLQNSGFVDAILEKYEKEPGQFYRVALPYRSMPSTSKPALRN